jgi:hypothetical protein
MEPVSGESVDGEVDWETAHASDINVRIFLDTLVEIIMGRKTMGSESMIFKELKGVVREAVAEGRPDFLDGLKYGLILSGLWEQAAIQKAWRQALAEAEVDERDSCPLEPGA